MFRKLLILFLVLSFFIGQLEFFGQDFFISKIVYVVIIFAGFTFGTLRYISAIGKSMILLLSISTISGMRLYGLEPGWLDLEWLLVILMIESTNILFRCFPNLYEFYRKTYIYISLIFAIVLLFYGDSSWAGRSTIFGLNQNYLAIILVIALLECMLIWKEGEQGTVGLVILSYCYVLAIFSTGSRTALIAMVVSAAILLFRQHTGTKKRMTIYVRSLVAAVFFTFITVVILGNDLLAGRMLNAITESDLSGRDEYWLEMPKWVGSNWFLGIGHLGLSTESLRTYGEIRNAHNLYVEMYIRTGILGLFVLLWLLIDLTRRCMDRNVNERSLVFLVLFLMLSFVAHPMTTLPLWIFQKRKLVG